MQEARYYGRARLNVVVATQQRPRPPSRCAPVGCSSRGGAVTPNPSLQRTRQKRRAAELEYRWASLSAVTHFRLRSRVGCRSVIGERSLSVQCCKEHQQLLVASALVPV